MCVSHIVCHLLELTKTNSHFRFTVDQQLFFGRMQRLARPAESDPLPAWDNPTHSRLLLHLAGVIRKM